MDSLCEVFHSLNVSESVDIPLKHSILTDFVVNRNHFDLLWISPWNIEDLLAGELESIMKHGFTYVIRLYESMNYTDYIFAQFYWSPIRRHFVLEYGKNKNCETIILNYWTLRQLLEWIQTDGN